MTQAENQSLRPGSPKLKSAMVALVYFIYNSFITHLPSYTLRRMYLVFILKIKIGKGVAIHMGCFFTGRNISIGNHTVINRNCYLDGRGGVKIGENVSVSPECYLVSLTHDVNSPEFATLPKSISIGNYSWLGARVMVMPGVILGDGVVVGAGSVVTKNIDPYEIVAGLPAKKIGVRPNGLTYTLAYFPWFNGDVQP